MKAKPQTICSELTQNRRTIESQCFSFKRSVHSTWKKYSSSKLKESYVYVICLKFMQRHIYKLCSECVLLFFPCLYFLKLFFQFMLENDLWRKKMFFVVTVTRCSCRRPRFRPQHPYGGSQPSLSPVPTDLMPAFGLHGYQAHTWCTHMHASKTPIKGNEKNLRTQEKFYE